MIKLFQLSAELSQGRDEKKCLIVIKKTIINASPIGEDGGLDSRVKAA